MTLEDLAFARGFVAECRWQYAASVEAHPHWYSVRRWLPAERRGDFDRLVALIAEHGYRGRFWNATWTYLEMDDGFRYWASREWFGDGDDDVMYGMLNRARVDDGQLALGVEQ